MFLFSFFFLNSNFEEFKELGEELKKEKELRIKLELKLNQLELNLQSNLEISMKKQLDSHFELISNKWSKIENSVSVEVQNQLVDFTNSLEGKLQFKRVAFQVLQDDYNLVVPGTEGFSTQQLDTAFWQGQEDIRKDLKFQQQQQQNLQQNQQSNLSNSSSSRLTLPTSNSSSNFKSSSTSTAPQLPSTSSSSSSSSANLTEAQRQAKDEELIQRYGLPITTLNALWKELATNDKLGKFVEYTKTNLKSQKFTLDKLDNKIFNLENLLTAGGVGGGGGGGVELGGDGIGGRKRPRINSMDSNATSSNDENSLVTISSSTTGVASGSGGGGSGGVGGIGEEQINKLNSNLMNLKTRISNIEGGGKSVASRLETLADSVGNFGISIEGMMDRVSFSYPFFLFRFLFLCFFFY